MLLAETETGGGSSLLERADYGFGGAVWVWTVSGGRARGEDMGCGFVQLGQGFLLLLAFDLE